MAHAFPVAGDRFPDPFLFQMLLQVERFGLRLR